MSGLQSASVKGAQVDRNMHKLPSHIKMMC